MKIFIFGIIIGCLIPIFIGLIFLFSGGIPVATSGSALPFERIIAKIAIREAIGDSESKKSPIEFDEPSLLGGAKIYLTNCAICHGNINGSTSVIAKGLFPKPPQLFKPNEGVTDDPIGETYWKVKNGIRLTGMPGFGNSLSDIQLWQVSELLLNAEKLPAKVHDSLLNR